VDERGRLWAVDDRTGDLLRLAGGDLRRISAAIGNGRLAVTQSRPAVVDPARGTAELLDENTGAVVRTARADLRANDVVAVTGSTGRSGVLIANSTRGELITCTFDLGTCAEPVKVAAAGADLGNPVEIEDHAVIGDHSTGKATIVDLATGRVVVQRELFSRPTRFELVTRDGVVFFNDPGGDLAGVLDLAGDVRTVVKYAQTPVEAETPPAPDDRAQADQAPTLHQDQRKPGLGLPRSTPRPTGNDPAPPPPPASGASIVVRPGNHGVVGDEFELTVLLTSPVGGWSVQWWLGDTTGDSGQTIRHRWQQPGVFTVQAIAIFDSGAKVMAETAVYVDPPKAPPRITSLNVQRPKPVVGERVHFSAGSSGNPESWSWTVSRPGAVTPEVTARTAEFDHAFASPGTYTVTLTVSTGTASAQSSRQFTVARGAVAAWGGNGHGEATPPPSAASGVVAIDAGDQHALALKANGSVISWGDNTLGQAKVPAEASDGVIAVSAGDLHSLALKADGSVIAWGNNSFGQTTVPPAAGRDVVAIAAGALHSLALKADGSVIGWGYNSYGQVTTPSAALSDVVAIAAGSMTSMALKADGTVVVWGDPDKCNTRELVVDAVAIAVGNDACLALKDDGSVVGWGSSNTGETSIPPAAESDVIAIDAHSPHVLALKKDGTAIGWGYQGSAATEVPPQYSRDVLAVSAGGTFSLVLR
jgi:PKD repeat protein